MTTIPTAADVTALIVAYRAEATIEKAIVSIRDQVGALIVVVDGGSDETVKIAEDCLSGRKFELVVNPDNVGVGKARQQALDLAVTDWIVWQDADDWSYEGRIEQMLSVAAEGKDLIFDRPVLVSVDDEVDPKELSFPDELLEPGRDVFQLARNMIPAHWPMERSDLAKVVGFNTQLRGAEDFDHQLRMMMKGAKIGVVPTLSYAYVDLPNSLSRARTAQQMAYHKALKALPDNEISNWLQRSKISETERCWIACQYFLRCERYDESLKAAISGYEALSAVDETARLSRADFAHIAGSAAWGSGSFELAAFWLERSLEQEELPGALNNLGVVRRALGNSDDDLIARALELSPGYRDALNNLAEKGQRAYTLMPLRRTSSRQNYKS